MPNPEAILELIDAFRRSKTLFAAVELGIFEGARPPGADLQRLLEACASLGLLERRDGEFVNSELADEYLRIDAPASLAAYIRYSNHALYPLWHELESAVIEGTPRWRRAFGWRGIGALTRLARRTGLLRDTFPSARYRKDFAAGMHAFGVLGSDRVAEAFDLSRFRTLVDLGGATGHLALAIRRKYPLIRIRVFDLPEVVADARRGANADVEWIGGDFFTAPLPRADLYVLGKVLHNWDDDLCVFLSKRVHAALEPQGALLVVERLLEEDRSGPASVHLHSLNMLVATSGRERTFSEYRTLLTEAGFRACELRRTGAITDAILAVK